ncbi:ABC transporter substrate-binding protein [Tessaracoccus sp.]
MSITKSMAGAALATALLLSACTGGDGTKNEGTAKPGETAPAASGPIRFVTDKAAWEPSFDDMNKTSAEKNLTLEFTGYSDPVAYDTYVRQAFRTKEKPDLFTWHTGGQLKELVEQGLVAETSEIWTEAESEGFVPEGLKDQYTFDGKQYCVPLNVAYWAVYYNKKIFADNGLEPPATWADMEKVLQTLKDKGVTPFHQMNIIFEFVYFMAFLAGQNTDTYLGILDGSASYTDEDVTVVMDQWQKMIKNGDFIDPGVTGDPQALLMNGDVAMAYFGTFFTGQLSAIDAVAGEDYGIFLMPNLNPKNDKQPMVLETGPLCVGAGAENEAAALEYSKWWLTTDAQTVWSDSRGDVSFNPQVEIADPELSALVASVTGDNSSKTQILPRYLEGSPLPVYQLSTELFGAFVTNAEDPRGVQEKLQAKAEEFWASQK